MVAVSDKRDSRTIAKKGFVRRKALARGSLFVAIPMLVSGCLFNRVMEVKQQACAFDENFELQFTEQPAIVLKQPVLLYQDILWMAGVEPTSTVEMPGELLVTFEAEEDVPKPNRENDLRIDLTFDQFEDEYRLSEIRFDPIASRFFNESYLDQETINQAADDVCNTGVSLGMSGMDMDLTDEDIAMLPTRPEVLQLVGPPHSISADGTGWEYRYRLKGQESGDPVARMTVWFDEDSDKPLRFESSYSRYRAQADIEAMKISMNIDL